MGRLKSARSGHIAKWILPAASQLLIDAVTSHFPTTSLAKIAYIEMGQSPDGNSHNQSGIGYPLIGGPADLGLVYPEPSRWTEHPTKLSKPGDIIVCVRATIGEPRWSNDVYCLGRGVAAIRPLGTGLDSRFLFRIVQANESYLREQGTGTTFKTISKAHLEQINIPIIPLSLQTQIADFLEWLEAHNTMRPDFTQAPPLPTFLDEQRHIVARIEELAAHIEEARGLRQQAVEDAKGLKRSIIFDYRDWTPKPTPMHELVSLRETDVFVSPLETYHFAGVYSFGRGVFVGDTKIGSEFSYSKLTKLRAGDFVYPKLMAWEGALGIVPAECDGLVVSPEFPVFELNQQKVLSETLDVYFRTETVWPLLAAISTGTNVRRRRLHPSAFLKFEFPLPPMEVQELLRAVSCELVETSKLQAETAAELDALLPSILDKAFKGEL